LDWNTKLRAVKSLFLDMTASRKWLLSHFTNLLHALPACLGGQRSHASLFNLENRSSFSHLNAEVYL